MCHPSEEKYFQDLKESKQYTYSIITDCDNAVDLSRNSIITILFLQSNLCDVFWAHSVVVQPIEHGKKLIYVPIIHNEEDYEKVIGEFCCFF